MDWHESLLAVVALAVVLDLVTGLAKAVKAGDISSKKMRDGLWHKVGYVAIVALALLVEWASGIEDFGFSVPVTVPVCIFIVLTEVASILENIVAINPDLSSKFLLGLFKSARDNEGEEE